MSADREGLPVHASDVHFGPIRDDPRVCCQPAQSQPAHIVLRFVRRQRCWTLPLRPHPRRSWKPQKTNAVAGARCKGIRRPIPVAARGMSGKGGAPRVGKEARTSCTAARVGEWRASGRATTREQEPCEPDITYEPQDNYTLRTRLTRLIQPPTYADDFGSGDGWRAVHWLRVGMASSVHACMISLVIIHNVGLQHVWGTQQTALTDTVFSMWHS